MDISDSEKSSQHRHSDRKAPRVEGPGKKKKGGNCISAILLTSYCMLAPLFLSLQVCPHFLSLNGCIAPVLLTRTNGVRMST